MLQLNALAKLVKKRKRYGRGGSRGGTSGRGHKGQKARTGDHGVGSGFEGGQMPLVRRLPKRGFNNKEFAKEYCLVHTSDLEKHFNNNDTITREILMQRGLVRGKKNATKFIKILHDADITKKLIVQIDAISKSAVQTIEKAGGNVQHVSKEI